VQCTGAGMELARGPAAQPAGLSHAGTCSCAPCQHGNTGRQCAPMIQHSAAHEQALYHKAQPPSSPTCH
jgi:hypothetical protein